MALWYLRTLTILTTQKIKIWKKWLKNPRLDTRVPQMTIIWCMVPEISSATDRIFVSLSYFFHFAPPPSHNPENQHFFKKEKQPWRYFHFKHEYHKSKSYDVYDSWDMNHMWTINDISYENHMIYGSWDINCNREIFLSSWVIFCPFTPLTAQKWKYKKMNKTPEDIIILHKCSKNHDRRLYCSWDVARDGCNSCISFWANFCSFTPITKMKNTKKKKKRPEISSFYTSVPKIMIIGYSVPEMWRVADVIVVFHFGQFFALLPP